MMINPEPEMQQKEKVSSKEVDTENVIIHSLRIPTDLFDKLKYEIGRETKASMRDTIMKAVAKHYGIIVNCINLSFALSVRFVRL